MPTCLGGKGGEPGRALARTRSHVKVLQWTFSALEKARVPVLAAVDALRVEGFHVVPAGVSLGAHRVVVPRPAHGTLSS